ncbi:hypothetical protein V1264_004821 [Littorina saxatilis]|uniref:BTB domain-containing protein n=1 Tax=Littorina saxatilis TaxID=31220 RepID=A0AAN9B5L0_9CAEN
MFVFGVCVREVWRDSSSFKTLDTVFWPLQTMMQRAPLREVAHIDSTNMPDQRSTKHTPDKTTDKAAVTVAAKLLDSAKKSQTKRLAKKMKLSLHKSAGSAGGKKQTARTLALCTTNDLNDTVEFKDSMPVRNVAKPPHASRKRKVAQQPQQAPKKKSLKRDREDAQMSAVSDCSSEAVQNTTADGRNANNLLTREVETAEAIDTDESSAPHTSSHCDKDTSQCDQDLSTSLHTCPTCGETMPQRKLVLHRTQCLRKQFGRCKAESAASNDDDKPCTDREHHTGDPDKQNHGEGKASTADYFFCQLCQKDLSHMNSHRRTLHINHCIDQEEKRKKTEEERQQALEAAKIQVLECPMCGKVLRTALGRKNHLKKCASSLGVQPDQLLAAVKRQEEEHQVTLAAGILPTSYRPGRQKVTSTHRGMAALPKSKLDEDTQLALAISSSLRPDTDSDAGPSTSENAAPANRRGRKNKQEDDYLLVKLTESQAADRIATRVSDLLMQQQEEEVDEDLIPPLPAVSRDLLRVRGDRKQTLQWTADETDADVKMFWRRACLESQSSITAEVDSDPSMEFYVGALMPPVELSRVVAGSKIRRMSEIPGRMGSQQVKMLSEAMEECSEQVTEEMEESSDEVSEDRPPPSTQTAALLADMAAEADGVNAATRLSSACLQTSAVDVERQVQQDLQSDYSSLVNQQEFSDVVIHAAGATTLYAHRVILSVRCPALLKMSAEGSGIVDLSDCSLQSVVSLLNFVYAGVTEVDDRWIQHTLKLADRFGLTGFAEICRNQLPVPASQHLSRQHSGDTTENYFTAHSLSSPVSAREEDKMSTADSNFAANSLSSPVSAREEDKMSTADSNFAANSLSSPVSAREEDKMSTADTINTLASVKDKDQTSSPDSITIQRHDLKDRVENNTTSNTISAPASEKEENKIDSSNSIRIHGHYPGDVAENDIPVCSFTAPVGAKEEDKMSLTDSISIHSECESVDAESEIQQNSTGARQRRKEQEEVALQSDSGHSEKGEAHRITDYAQHSEMDDRTQQADDADMTEKLTKSPVNMTESPIEIRESPAKMRESRLETRESLLNSDSTSTSEQNSFNHKQNKPNLERKLKRGDKTKVDFSDQEKEALNSATRDSSCPVGGALSTEKEASNTEADQAKDFFSAELERDLGEKIQTVCRMVDEEGDIQAVNTTSCSLLAGKTAQSAESMNGSFSEDDDVHLLDVSLPSESRTQLFSTKVIAGEDHVRRKAVQQADEMTAGHAIDPVDSIEISDDDLFSSDEIDISLLPSTPQHSRQIHASQKPNLEERSETSGSTAEVEEGPPTLEPQALTKTVLVQDGQQTEDSVTNSSGEVRRSGRDEVKDTFIVPSPTARPHMTRQGQPAPGFEDSVSCFSLSAVESSYRAPSLSSPNVTSCFKTSTPQAGANSQSAGRTVSRTETGLASDKRNWFECGEQSVTDLTVISRADADRPELMPAHSKELTIVSDFRSPATTNVSSSTVICEATGTPRVSVVEQDSLYITPVVEQGRIRRTFQLVTPASQHQGASLSPTTPTSHAAVGLNVSPEVRVGNRLEREFRSQQCDSAGDSSPASAGMHVEFGGISEGKMDSDSDLEIIDTSLQDPPSPKFSLASKPSSSQSQTGAQPSNQHSPDPQPLTLSRSNSTPVMSSQSKTKPSSQSESRGKSRSGNQRIGEASSASRSCDKDTARTNPGTPVSGLSQRSADSDRDLVRAVEMVSQQLAAAVTETGPVHLADCGKQFLC